MRQAELRGAPDAATLQARRLRTLHEIDRGILAAESVQAIAVGALSRMRDLVPCERVSIGILDWEEHEAVVFAAEVDSDKIDTTGKHYPMDTIAEIMESVEAGLPFLVRDMAREQIPGVLKPFRDVGLRSSLQMPLGGAPLIGILSLMADRPDAFGVEEIEIAVEVAAQLAIAIEHQRLRDAETVRAEELRRLVEELERSQTHRAQLLRRLVDAHEDERRVVAAAVHDDAIQKMSALVLRLDLLAHEHPDVEGGAFQELRTTVQESIDGLRGLMFELHPYALDTEGLVPALRLFLKEQQKRGDDPRYDLYARIVREPPPEVRATLFRIAQEAVRNARKHAHARTVTIVVDEADGGYRLTVTDDGVGFDADSLPESPPGHLGLTAMRERAEMVGGHRHVISTPDAGTTVEAWVPDVAVHAERV
jgi:signal transduction histidine kinase